MHGLSRREAEHELARISPTSILPAERAKPVSESHSVVTVVLSSDAVRSLERLRGLLAHRKPAPEKFSEIIEHLIQRELKRLEPAERGTQVEEPGQAAKFDLTPPAESLTPRRRVPKAGLRRRIFERDQSQCSWTDPITGRRCRSSHGLEIDHRVPYALGGETTADNLRLLCRAHHRLETQAQFAFSAGAATKRQ
jgi:5-methylcytosine-specific restriction endonuclease McrA